MAFISEKVKKNSQKCKECAFLKMRQTKMSKYNVFYESAVLSIEGIFRASCAMCPFEPDFEKVYGMMPCEYFPMKKIK